MFLNCFLIFAVSASISSTELSSDLLFKKLIQSDAIQNAEHVKDNDEHVEGKFRDLQRGMDILFKEILKLRSNNKNMNGTIKTILNDNVDMKNNLSNQAQQIRYFKEEISNLVDSNTNTLTNHKKEIDALSNENVDLKQHLTRKGQEIYDLKQRVSVLMAKNEEWENNNEQAIKQNADNLTRIVARQDEEIRYLELLIQDSVKRNNRSLNKQRNYCNTIQKKNADYIKHEVARQDEKIISLRWMISGSLRNSTKALDTHRNNSKIFLKQNVNNLKHEIVKQKRQIEYLKNSVLRIKINKSNRKQQHKETCQKLIQKRISPVIRKVEYLETNQQRLSNTVYDFKRRLYNPPTPEAGTNDYRLRGRNNK